MKINLTEFNRREVLEYLQWRGSKLPVDVEQQIDFCMQETIRTAQPRWCWRVFDLNRIQRQPVSAFVSNDVRELLFDCKRVVYMAATLGASFDAAIRREQARDLTRAVILDCCGSAAIERVCDEAEQEILKELGGGYLTDRFSPGYGDFPIAEQPNVLAAVDAARAIGLTVTENDIMVPRKSVSALIGVADCVQTKRFRGCAYCSMFEECAYRKAGKTCGRK